MIKWERMGKKVLRTGTFITYWGIGTPYTIESRTIHIQHANGIGTWDCTSYWVWLGEDVIKETMRLKDAKAFVEELVNGKTE